jgi:hypothetical protein
MENVLSGSLPRAVAWVLIIGAVVFWIGAGTPPYKQWMGPPVGEYLTIIGTHPKNWMFINGSFALACVLSVPALAGLTAMLRSAGDRGWSAMAFAVFAVGAALWLVHLGHRLAVTPWAAEEFLRTGAVPTGFEATKRWMGLLFVAYMAMAYLAMSLYGMAILETRLLPRWAGLMAAVFGLVAIPGMATPVFQPPLMVHVVPFAIGVAILRAV